VIHLFNSYSLLIWQFCGLFCISLFVVSVSDAVRLLQEDPVLFQLYKDLVAANVITAEEFWANRFTVSLYHCSYKLFTRSSGYAKSKK